MAGVAAYLVISLIVARRLGLRWWFAAILSVAYALGMMVGAKAMYDCLHGQFSVVSLVNVKHYAEGGMWGGPLAFLALAVPLAWLIGRPRGLVLDCIALSLPVPMTLAKIGCLCQGCCYDGACAWPWAVRFPQDGTALAGVPIHPTQAYEILVLLCVPVVLVCLYRSRWRGLLLAWFLLLYGVGRSLTEVWRADKLQTWSLGPMSPSQIILIGTGVAAAMVVLASGRRGSRATAAPTPESPIDTACFWKIHGA
jgi:phosphatidylglycerol:prolipoprotein diacylglycerol transferase